MSTLFITTQFPYPLDNGGKIGAFNGISVVSNDDDVTVLSFTEERETVEQGINYFNSLIDNVTFKDPVDHDVHIRNKPSKLLATMIRSYLTATPYVAAKFVNSEMFRLIDECFKENNFDVVFIDYLNMYPYARYIKKHYNSQFEKMVFKNHNIEYEIVEQEYHKQSGLKKIILGLEWKRTKRYEVKAIQDNSLVFTVCDENTDYFKQYNDNVYSMKPTYDVTDNKQLLASDKSILYIGNISWEANMNGLKWFVDNVWPIIKTREPQAVLNIVGSGKADNPFENVEGINMLGYVEDLDEMYQSHRAFIVPLFEGSGIRIKILEAFNNGIPVVSTKLACDTIGAGHGQELFIADTAEEFSESVLNLLESDETNKSMSVRAKEFLKKHYSLSSRREEYQGILSLTQQESF